MATIMIVEDDPIIREALSQLLQMEGYFTSAFPNGREALESLRKKGEPPCLIFLDLMMPVMGGVEFQQKRCQDPQLASIPVVLFTGDSATTSQFDENTVVGVLKKPIDFKQLLKYARQYC